MIRTLGVILLSLCVLAMPSYAAITCGSACTTETDTHEHACCPDDVATAHAGSAHEDGRTGSSHSGSGGRHHCAAPCCGYVATVLTASTVHVDSQPLADLIPTAAAPVGSVDHESIFHPPRF